jgi:hypothetical protein
MCCSNEIKYILDHTNVPTVFTAVCRTISGIVPWKSDFNGEPKTGVLYTILENIAIIISNA